MPAGTTALQALKEAGVPLKGPDGAVVVRDVASGDLKDLAWAPDADAEVEPVPAASPDGRAVIRHSTAHVLAQAVQELFPGTRLGIGPPVENGFYYDFDPERPFTPEDLQALEKKMTEIVRAGQNFARREISDADAKAELAHEPYKLELIGLKGGDADARHRGCLRRGRRRAADHVRQPRRRAPASGSGPTCAAARTCRAPAHIPAFSLTRSAAAYWRGSEKNPQLQRIYGTAWESKDAHKAYLEQLAEAERRDHRRLGAELDLFSFPDEIGSGLAVFHPKGGVIKREMEDYVRARHIEEGFDYVGTPHITKGGLFETSGHLPYYEDTMFPADGAGEREVLPQGHELPDAQPDLPVARAVLPRAAAAVLRVRLGLPVREVRRRARPHPRARARPRTTRTATSPRSRRPARSGTCCRSCSAC